MDTKSEKESRKATDTHAPMTEAQKAKFKAAMKDRGVSQYAIAEGMDIHPSRLSQWLNGGQGQPSMTTGHLIERFLDLPAGWLASPDYEPLPEFRTEDQRLLLALCDDLGISPREAMRRLAASTRAPAPAVAVPPKAGEPPAGDPGGQPAVIRVVRRKSAASPKDGPAKKPR